jgi:hypothetical protein
MDCPQCGAEVPSDDLFCGKCGYAMRDGSPERVDQSRIRVHEEPASLDEQQPPTRGASQQRIRKHTVMGMPVATPPAGTRTPEPAVPPPPPTEISTARSRADKRTPQKTMLGIPRPDFPVRPVPPVVERTEEEASERSPQRPSDTTRPDSAGPSHRPRTRVRYDSANEPVPALQRRKKALGGLAVLVILSTAWLAYRYLSLNG